MAVISGDKYERIPDDWEAMKYNGNNGAAVQAWLDQYKVGTVVSASDGSLSFHTDVGQPQVVGDIAQGTFILINLTTLDVSLVDKNQAQRWRKKLP